MLIKLSKLGLVSLICIVIYLSFFKPHTSEHFGVIQPELDQVHSLLKKGNTDQALPLIIQLIHKTDDSQTKIKTWLYEQEANVHQYRLHFHYAINALTKARELSQNKLPYDKKIIDLKQKIDAQQNERNTTVVYENARHSGMAKTLNKKVTVAYIYLDDNQWSKWSAKQRQRNQFNLEQVKQWYAEQAHKYNRNDLDIQVRYFYLKSPKGLSKEWLRSNDFFKHAHNMISRQLGYVDIRDFVEVLSNYDKTHNVALVFHSNNNARSFARSCNNTGKPNRCFFEYVMLTEKMNNNPFSWAIPQVQAHEILHLFGASDLYNIVAAKDYAVTDIMNYYSRELKYATIDPITAWAVGWHLLPKTPFPVENSKD